MFLGNARGALIVALTIPFSLLFASICLKLRHIPANLLSLGALDFGMVVDGAVVMVENIVRHLEPSPRDDRTTPMERFAKPRMKCSGRCFTPSASSSPRICRSSRCRRVEGRLFKPMAWTVAFALLGALIFSMLIAPVLASLLFAKGMQEWHNPVLDIAHEALPGDACDLGHRASLGDRWRRRWRAWLWRSGSATERGHRFRVPAASR